jgi:DNA repair protein RecO (recombination protein O)
MVQEKTRGIVLGYIRYSETSIIVRVYTETFGTHAYIVNGVRSAKAKTNKIALYQPLTLVEIVAYQSKRNDGLARMSEARCYSPYTHLSSHLHKTSIALFLSEVLQNVLWEESPNTELFSFVESSLAFFDLQTTQIENFHLRFLLKLTRFLGFEPSSANDFYNQIYRTEYQSWKQIIPAEEQNALDVLIRSPYDETLTVSTLQRRHLLEQILRFYEIHLDNWKPIKSVEVLRSLLA